MSRFFFLYFTNRKKILFSFHQDGKVDIVPCCTFVSRYWKQWTNRKCVGEKQTMDLQQQYTVDFKYHRAQRAFPALKLKCGKKL